jgi:hypothetical protein
MVTNKTLKKGFTSIFRECQESELFGSLLPSLWKSLESSFSYFSTISKELVEVFSLPTFL